MHRIRRRQAADRQADPRLAPLRHGIRANWPQFVLQMGIILCVGLTIGTERTVLPLIGKQDFHIQSSVYISSFVISFGLAKAFLNLVAGRLSERFGRKPILLTGWISALPVPLLLITARSWSWVILANVLLGVNQGLAWSMSVNAKIDLAGPARRGLVVGLDEAGGYVGVALAALVTGYLAAAYGLRPAPFLFAGLVIVTALLMTISLMEETLPYALAEPQRHAPSPPPTEGHASLSFARIFLLASFRDRTRFALSQAGAIEKFVDALVWVAFPLYLSSQQLSVAHIGELVFIYGMVWGLAQILTGQLADLIGRKLPITIGMFLCGGGVFTVPLVHGRTAWALAAAATGLGMALLYPNLVTAAADASPPAWRATGLGVYRFWRDAGYAFGALFVGVVAASFGLPVSFYAVAVAMGVSGVVTVVLLRETRPAPR